MLTRALLDGLVSLNEVNPIVMNFGTIVRQRICWKKTRDKYKVSIDKCHIEVFFEGNTLVLTVSRNDFFCFTQLRTNAEGTEILSTFGGCWLTIFEILKYGNSLPDKKMVEFLMLALQRLESADYRKFDIAFAGSPQLTYF